jgi:hypothetical protein
MDNVYAIAIATVCAMTFQAYFDDSGTDAHSPLVVVAGFVASTNDWLSLSGEWNRLLDRHRLPYMHMAEAEAGAKHFKSAPLGARRSLIHEFADIVATYVRCGICAEIPKAEYAQVVVRPLHGLRYAENVFGNHYNLLHSAAIYGTERQCKHFGIAVDETEIIFSQQSDKWVAEQVGRSDSRKCGFPNRATFANMRQRPALQAADMFAWLMRRRDPQGMIRVDQRHAGLVHKPYARFVADGDWLRTWAIRNHEGILRIEDTPESEIPGIIRRVHGDQPGVNGS